MQELVPGTHRLASHTVLRPPVPLFPGRFRQNHNPYHRCNRFGKSPQAA